MPPRGKIANNPAAGCGCGPHGASAGVRCGRARGPRPVRTAPAMPLPRRPRPGLPPRPARLRRARPRARRRAPVRRARAQARAEARKTGERRTMACVDLSAFAMAEAGLEGIPLNAGSCQRSWDFKGAGWAGSARPHLMISYSHDCKSAGSINKNAKPAPVRSQAGAAYRSGRGKSDCQRPQEATWTTPRFSSF